MNTDSTLNKIYTTFIFFILLFFLLIDSYPAQNSQVSEIQKLNQQVFTLAKEGKFDEAISLAEEIVKRESKSRSLNPQSYAVLLDNLARLKEKRIKQNKILFDSNDLSKSEENKILRKMQDDAQDGEELFRKVLAIYKDEIKSDTVHSASVKAGFASFLYLYSNSSAFEVGQLYSEAVSSYKKLLGEKSEKTLSATLELGKYYFEKGKLEESLAIFEDYIQTVQKYLGENSPWLVPALRYYAVILLTIDLNDEAQKAADQISKMTGQKESLENKILDLSSRTADSRLNITINPFIFRKVTPELRNDARLKNVDALVSADGSGDSRVNILYTNNSVKVLVDEDGRVIEAKSFSDDKKLAEKAENAVMKWKFKPFIYQGKARRLKGVVIYKVR